MKFGKCQCVFIKVLALARKTFQKEVLFVLNERKNQVNCSKRLRNLSNTSLCPK